MIQPKLQAASNQSGTWALVYPPHSLLLSFSFLLASQLSSNHSTVVVVNGYHM